MFFTFFVFEHNINLVRFSWLILLFLFLFNEKWDDLIGFVAYFYCSLLFGVIDFFFCSGNKFIWMFNIFIQKRVIIWEKRECNFLYKKLYWLWVWLIGTLRNFNCLKCIVFCFEATFPTALFWLILCVSELVFLKHLFYFQTHII